jgi:hypothetical protein
MSYANRLANRGYTADMIFQALAKKPSGKRDPGSMKYQRILDERGRDVADAYARRTAEKAIAFVAANPKIVDRAGALLRVAELQAAADSLPWGVYGGPDARRALEGAFVVADRVGGPAFGLAGREWGELVGMTRDAVREQQRVLERLGWLRRNPLDRDRRTARFTLHRPPPIHSHGWVCEWGTHDGRRWLAHDAFRGDALGSVGWYVLASLDVAPTRLDLLQARTGVDGDDLGIVLHVLDQAGAVFVDEEVAHRAADPAAALELIADQRGTLGSASRDRARHEAERVAFHARGDVNGGNP